MKKLRRRQTNAARLIAEWAERNRLADHEKERIRNNIMNERPDANLEWLPYLYKNMDFFLRMNQDRTLMKRFSS